MQLGQSWRYQESEIQTKRSNATKALDPDMSVRVKNVPFSATEEDVSAYFSRAGHVEDVHWPMVDKKRASWLFVQFSVASSVTEACNLSGQLMMGREITVVPMSHDGPDREMKLNLGQAVKDCWFCLSNEQVCSYRPFKRHQGGVSYREHIRSA